MRSLIISAILLLAVACQPEPKPIDYGHESCEYCRMSIVEKRYAAQLVSSKNKAYSFDAIECMVNYHNENPEQQWALKLVTDYTEPEKLIPAPEAVLIRSKELPSPMGMYLTAVGSRQQAEQLQEKHGGKIYQFKEVEDSMDKLPAL